MCEHKGTATTRRCGLHTPFSTSHPRNAEHRCTLYINDVRARTIHSVCQERLGAPGHPSESKTQGTTFVGKLSESSRAVLTGLNWGHNSSLDERATGKIY